MSDALLIQAGLAAVSAHSATQALRYARSDLAKAEHHWCACHGIERRGLDAATYADMKEACTMYHDAVRKAKGVHYNAKRRLDRAAGKVSPFVF